MGGNIIRYPLREKLEGLLSNWDLVDIKPHNGKYTGSNRMAEGVFITARLDQFLGHSSCLIQDLDLQLSIVAFEESDHSLVLLVLDKKDDLGPIHFHYNPGWVLEEGVRESTSLTR